MKAIFSLLCLLLLAPFHVQAAEENTAAKGPLPRYYKVYSQGVPYAGRQQATFSFSVDYDRCRAEYGKNGDQICMATLTGRSMQGAGKLVMNPPMPGDWYWDYEEDLVFEPSADWIPDTRYTVDFSNILPSNVVLTRSSTFSTAPMKLSSYGLDWKFDPSTLKTMAVTGSLSFNYRVDKQSVLSRLRVENGSEMSVGQPVYTWDSNGSTLHVSVPVLSLPPQQAPLRLVLEDGYTALSGGRPGPGEIMEYGVPGKDRLFAFNEVTLSTVTNAKFQAEQILSLDFSLYASPAKILPYVKVLLLPRQRVQSEDGDKKGPYRWDNMNELTPEVLAASTELKLTPVGDADVASTLVNYRFEAEPGRALFVTVSRGAPGLDGLTLAQNSTALVTVPPFREELRIMQNGAILPLPGDKKLSLYSRNLDSIDYTVYQVRPEFLNIFTTQNEGSFEDPSFWAISKSQLSIMHQGKIPLARKSPADAQFAALDLGPVLASPQAPASGKGMFMISLQGQRDGYERGYHSRFVLVTDLGIIRKQAVDGSASVFVASLSGGKPAPGVTVEVLGANGLPVFSGLTDASGKVDVPSLNGLRADKYPTALVATLGADKAFLNLCSHEGEQDHSAFATGGNVSSQSGLVGLLFAQRGIFRPGETLHFGYIIKENSWKSVAGLPLTAVLTDPRGNEVAEKKFTLSEDGLGELAFDTVPTAPTGSYNLDLRLSNELLASQEVLVQEFEPDTQRITVRLDPLPGKGWLKPQDISLDVQLVNLFGAPAPDRLIKGFLNMERDRLRFEEYADWTFYTPGEGVSRPDSVILPETRSDENGDARFSLPLDQYNNASYRMRVTAQGFEPGGGRAVMATASALVSPLDTVTGWRSAANLDYLRQNGQAAVEFLTIDRELKPRALDGLTLETVAVSWVKTLVRDSDGQYVYENMPRYKTIKSRTVQLPESGLSVPLDTATPGQFILQLQDGAGTRIAKVDYRVAGEAAAQLDAEITPSLQLRLNKSDYNPGETVEFSLALPYSGTGLITVERDKVEASAWFKAKAGESVQRITLPADFEGKGYINVSFFRDVRDKDVFAKPLVYAVAPFTVNMGGRDMGLEIKAPAKARPGLPMSFDVTAAKPGRAIVYAVDEGILQITRYQTPDPLRHFLGNRALEVETYQYLELLMPEYSLFQNALKVFGGGEGADFAGLGQNPFRREGDKPAVFWMGIMDVGPEAQTVEITPPPSFSGQLRIMAVGCGKSVLGAASASTLVQADVVILPNLPYFVAPGDTFTASLALTDMSGAPERKISLSAETEAGITLLGKAPVELTLKAGREQTVDLLFRAGDEPGGTRIIFKVTPEGENPVISERPTGISVRPATPRSTETLTGMATANSQLPFSRNIYPQFAAWSASVSTAPLPMAQAMINYLLYYPYGCTEQIISGAMPAISLLQMPEFAPPGPDYTPEALRKRINETMAGLGYRNDGDGNLSAWPSSRYYGGMFWTVYAADFLTSAEEAGVAVPYSLHRSLLRRVEEYCSGKPDNVHDARLMAWGAWVLTRKGTLTTSILSNLTFWLRENRNGWESDIAAAFMACCWKMMMQDQEAERLIASSQPRLDYAPEYSWPFTVLSTRSMYMTLVARHFPARLNRPEMQGLVDSILEQTARMRYDTFSAAQGARAILAFAKGRAGALEGLQIEARDSRNQVLSGEHSRSKALLSLTLSPQDAAAVRSLDVTGSQPGQPWYWQITSTGYDATLPTQVMEQGISLTRELLRPDGSPAENLRQGDEVLVRISGRTLDGSYESLQNVAILDLLPGALELVRGDADQPENAMDLVYEDRREDRITLFVNLETRMTSYVYKARVTFKGDFVQPPLSASAMYQPWLKASTAASRMKVE